MGIDTRFFGPSAWQLFHYIAFHSKSPQKFLKGVGDILPCKFCRESTKQFISEMSVRGTTEPSKWLYDLHNRVNHKLRSQCADDPQVVNPGPDPVFEEVKKRYENMELKNILGRDFLFSIAVNYDGKTPHIQEKFLNDLGEVYPTDIKSYMEKHPPALESNKSYMKWMYGLLSSLGGKDSNLPTYRGYVQRLMYYTSGCEKKTYKGKTCRRVNGFRTKARDNRKTYKITHDALVGGGDWKDALRNEVKKRGLQNNKEAQNALKHSISLMVELNNNAQNNWKREHIVPYDRATPKKKILDDFVNELNRIA